MEQPDNLKGLLTKLQFDELLLVLIEDHVRFLRDH